VVQRASTHPRVQARLLAEEYARWGLTFRISEPALRRAQAEIELADRVLIPSDWVRRTFRDEGLADERLLLLPFGVDTARFRPILQPAPHPFRVLFVGQVGLRKGVPDLLEAWRTLGWHDAELWLVGPIEDAARPVFQRWAGLPGVRFVAYTPDPTAVYSQADVFAFPSLEEGSALVTYEAMACGLPVVTTPNAGSIVRDGQDGWLVPGRDPATLADRLERLRADEPLRRAMGEAARRRAESYTWDAHGAALARLLAGLLADGYK